MNIKPDARTLQNRATMPIRDTFTDWGYAALESVIKGRITPSQADYALMMLRDCILDRGGDLMSKERMKMYVYRLKEPKESIDLSGYSDEY